MGCVESVGCAGCVECVGCAGCVGCVECVESVECVECVECVGCVECVECVECVGCVGLVRRVGVYDVSASTVLLPSICTFASQGSDRLCHASPLACVSKLNPRLRSSSLLSL